MIALPRQCKRRGLGAAVRRTAIAFCSVEEAYVAIERCVERRSVAMVVISIDRLGIRPGSFR